MYCGCRSFPLHVGTVVGEWLWTCFPSQRSQRNHSCPRLACPMSTYRLDKLFSPRSVALIGASPRLTSPGRAVLRNLRDAGFKGPIRLVNPHYDEIEGIRSVRSFDELPEVPDLVVIAAPPQAVPAIVATAGEKGTAAGIIITSGLG